MSMRGWRTREREQGVKRGELEKREGKEEGKIEEKGGRKEGRKEGTKRSRMRNRGKNVGGEGVRRRERE